MQLVWLPDATRRPRRLAVGEFDGVHAGHREVIRGADADPERLLPLNDALAFHPEVRLDDEQARRASHGSAGPAPPAAATAATVRLIDDQGLIAIAEPREQGRLLKPVVGLRG